jgi:hypothetical protein
MSLSGINRATARTLRRLMLTWATCLQLRRLLRALALVGVNGHALPASSPVRSARLLRKRCDPAGCRHDVPTVSPRCSFSEVSEGNRPQAVKTPEITPAYHSNRPRELAERQSD